MNSIRSFTSPVSLVGWLVGTLCRWEVGWQVIDACRTLTRFQCGGKNLELEAKYFF